NQLRDLVSGFDRKRISRDVGRKQNQYLPTIARINYTSAGDNSLRRHRRTVAHQQSEFFLRRFCSLVVHGNAGAHANRSIRWKRSVFEGVDVKPQIFPWVGDSWSSSTVVQFEHFKHLRIGPRRKSIRWMLVQFAARIGNQTNLPLLLYRGLTQEWNISRHTIFVSPELLPKA